MLFQLKSIILLSTSVLFTLGQASPYVPKRGSLNPNKKSIQRRQNLVAPIWSECAAEIEKVLAQFIRKDEEQEQEEEKDVLAGNEMMEKEFIGESVVQTLLSGHRLNTDGLVVELLNDILTPSLPSSSLLPLPLTFKTSGKETMLFGGVSPPHYNPKASLNFSQGRVDDEDDEDDEDEFPPVSMLGGDDEYGTEIVHHHRLTLNVGSSVPQLQQQQERMQDEFDDEGLVQSPDPFAFRIARQKEQQQKHLQFPVSDYSSASEMIEEDDEKNHESGNVEDDVEPECLSLSDAGSQEKDEGDVEGNVDIAQQQRILGAGGDVSPLSDVLQPQQLSSDHIQYDEDFEDSDEDHHQDDQKDDLLDEEDNDAIDSEDLDHSSDHDAFKSTLDNSV